MKKIFLTLALLAVAAWPLSALAGEGYRCTNACPLAKKANQHRATGAESARMAETVRHEVAKTVADNLDRI